MMRAPRGHARHVLLLSLFSLWLLPLEAGAVEIDSALSPELQQRYDALSHEFRCVQCQNQSIADSPVGLASDLRRDVRDQLLAGKSDEQIRDTMVARYGNFILFRPPFKSGTAWVWIAPFIFLLVAFIATWRILRQRSRMMSSDDSEVAEDLNR